ncbi:uncharacterized protein LOC134815597 isoform X2 [Bolinopsis microptera]|uniref:uncharacterized protein LOC134815597 isoform X2 n=1 Tax=Bolinopsis microptera TaxID=2820187 RepID=UPI00307A1C6B
MVMDEPKFATVVATHDFDPGTLGLNRAKSRTLLVYKGDKFKVFSIPNREWWGARCLGNDTIGYIPSAYVKPISDMDIAAIAAIAKEVKINARAKQTATDKKSTELSNVLAARQKGTAGPIKQRKEHKVDPNDGMSSELQKMLAKRNKIIEEDEEVRTKETNRPELFKAMKHRNIAIAQDEVKPEEPAAQNADADDQGDNYDDEGPYSDEEYSDSDYSDEES